MNGRSALLGGDLAGGEAVGILTALALVVVLRLALREGARRLARPPIVLLGLHIVVLAVDHLVPLTAPAQRLLRPLALLLLLGSIARSAVLLVLDVLVGQRI